MLHASDFARSTSSIIPVAEDDGPGGRRARPRDAASLVLVRERAGVREVLVGRRSQRHGFLPGLYVFPGGTVEGSDSRAPCGSELRPAVGAVLARHVAPPRARALAVAALRETWEEAGWPLGAVRDNRLVPDLAHVLFVARAITPARLPRRFHARFFAARCDDADSPSASVSGELQDLRWIAMTDANADLPMLDVTRFVIRQVASLSAWRQPAAAPLLCFRSGKPMLRDG